MADAPKFDNVLSDNQQAALADQVTAAYKSGVAPEQIIAKLIQTPVIGAHVEDAIANGTDVDHIINQFGGQPLAQFKATDPAEKVKAQSFGTNVWQGAKNAVGDLGHGVEQLALRAQAAGIGNTDEDGRPLIPGETPEQIQADSKDALKQVQAEQAAREADPARQALEHTAGGKIGSGAVKAVPYIGAAALTDGSSLLPSILAQGGAGALEGATTPTTGEGQIGKNILRDALIGAGTQGALGVAGKAVNAVKNIGADSALAQEMTAAGLTPTVGTTNGLAKALGTAVSGSKDAMNEYGKQDIVQAALKPFGITGEKELTPSVLEQAERNTWSNTNQLLKNATVPATPKFTQQVGDVVQKYTADALPTTADSKVAGIAQDILAKANAGELTGPRAVDYLRQARNLSYTATNAADRDAFKGLQQSLSDAISDVSPEASQSLAESNALHQKLLVLRDVSDRAKGANPTAQQFAVSNTKFSPKAGTAGPYQDLSNAANKAYGAPSGSTGRYSTLLSAMGKLALPVTAGVLGGEHSGLTGALLASALEKGGEKLGGSVLGKVLNRPVSAAAQVPSRSRLRSALMSATKGGISGGIADQQ